jgi:hypothetical protein
MKNADDFDAVSVSLIEDDMPALLEASDAGQDRIAGSAQTR